MNVYSLRNANRSFVYGFILFFKNYCQKQGEQPCGGTENVVTGFSLTLLVPQLINHELILQSCHSAQYFLHFFLIAFVHVTNWYKCLQ